MSKAGGRLCLLALAFLILWCRPARAQETPKLQLAHPPDTSAFPLVQLTLKSVDSEGAPLPALDGLKVEVNGNLVADYSLDQRPEGMDVIILLDANRGIQLVDSEGDITRQEKVKISLARFASQYMDPAGLDRVSVIVPEDSGSAGENGDKGRFLVSDVADPAVLVAAVDGYEPQVLADTPLNQMLVQALALASTRRNSGRFQAILLFTDAVRLEQQLDFTMLAAQAVDSAAPIYVSILGARADAGEIASAAKLYEPAGGFYAHLSDANQADVIYETWRARAGRWLLQFRPEADPQGQYQVVLQLGQARMETSFEVDLAPPIVRLLLEPEAADNCQLTMTACRFMARINWPDDIERQLSHIELLLDGVPLLASAEPGPDENGAVTLVVEQLPPGRHEVVASVTDELGLSATSQPVTIEIVEPAAEPEVAPPAATEPDTPGGFLGWLQALPLPSLSQLSRLPQLPQLPPLPSLPGVLAPLSLPPPSVYLIAGALALLVPLSLVWRYRRRQLSQKPRQPGRAVRQQVKVTPPQKRLAMPTEATPQVAYLYLMEQKASDYQVRIPLSSARVSIGRDPEKAAVAVDDDSVLPVQAWIKRRGRSYWLFDESSGKTYLNYVPLGLAPQELQPGDIIQVGRFSFKFALESQQT